MNKIILSSLVMFPLLIGSGFAKKYDLDDEDAILGSVVWESWKASTVCTTLEEMEKKANNTPQILETTQQISTQQILKAAHEFHDLAEDILRRAYNAPDDEKRSWVVPVKVEQQFKKNSSYLWAAAKSVLTPGERSEWDKKYSLYYELANSHPNLKRHFE